MADNRRVRGPTTPTQEPTQEELLNKLMERFDDVNTVYITKVARQIKTIGELNAASMHRMEIFASMQEDIAEINRMLADAVQMAKRDVMRLFDKALNDMYHSPRFERALQETPLPEPEKARLNNYAQMVARQTAGTMENLSNTTAISGDYQKVVDKAILANTSGLDSYKGAMRDAVRELGTGGMRIEYESGHHRRLDSAIRQNIIDGSAQIAQHGSDMMGEALGYKAKELSAHLASAPDHEPVQGRVFLNGEFEKMQNGQDCTDISGTRYAGFRRQIGQWNCMHFAMSFDTRYSVRKYTDAQLKKWAEDNAKGCEINGKHYTLYQARQLMRRIETQVRREKDVANAARAAGDDDLRRQCQERINQLSKRYGDVAKASGFRERRDRMRVEGFRKVKVDPDKSAASLAASKNKATPETTIERVGHVDREDQEAVNGTIDKFEDEVRSAPIEHAVVIAKTGNIYRCAGIKDGVNIGLVGEYEDLADAIVSHNHPIDVTEYSFGEDDRIAFGSYGLAMLRGVDLKYSYELNRYSSYTDPHHSLVEIMNDPELAEHEYNIDYAETMQVGYRRTAYDGGYHEGGD